MAVCLEDQFRPNESDDQFRDHYKFIRRGLQRFRNTKFDSRVEPVSGNEVRKVIKNLKSNKAPGYDGVTNCMIKQLLCHFVNHLVAIYNCELELQHFPTCWKKAEGPQVPSEQKTDKSPQLFGEDI